MKKTMSLVAVLAIVLVAFAFSPAKFSRNYCVADQTSTTCPIFLEGQFEIGSGTQYFWNESPVVPQSEEDCQNFSDCNKSILLMDEVG